MINFSKLHLHKCADCGCTDKVIFKNKVDDVEIEYICADCMKLRGTVREVIETNQMEFADSYILRWKLRDEKGKCWIETHDNISLSDFDVIYSSNKYEVLWFTARKRNVALI